MADKDHAYLMYPRDWNENQRLKLCSYAAQGLWIRLCNTSFFMEKPGVFSIENTKLSAEKICDLLPGKTAEKRRLFAELVKWNVIKQDEHGTFYCKRIKRVTEIRSIRKASGSKGGNPVLVVNLDKQVPNQKYENHEILVDVAFDKSNQDQNQSSTNSVNSKEQRQRGVDTGLDKTSSKNGLVLALDFGKLFEKHFGPFNKSEKTTFTNIAVHLGKTNADHAAVVSAVNESKAGKKPKALFNKFCKDRFGFSGMGKVSKKGRQ